ncbi:hypothetical protein VK792_14680 [Mesobacterium sp. TK19101]|uniref:DUF1127 domain-containing protein n=1 Tax=Mesobacterium hydrothermale TaxID=3111907 RepID=A0ABU6HKY4_9RHOB|nr:hypothetical protein [Mesobacterium sp. TK19101]MEC3862536.1 hypothetical protein [Mesobacterium sp. TK19101]
MTLFTNLRSRMAKAAAYRRTVNEIRRMPKDVADDLGIYPGDARRMAYRAVYGL